MPDLKKINVIQTTLRGEQITQISIGDDLITIPGELSLKYQMSFTEEEAFRQAFDRVIKNELTIDEFKTIMKNLPAYGMFQAGIVETSKNTKLDPLKVSQEEWIEQNRVLEREERALEAKKSRQEKLDKLVQAYVLGRITLTELCTQTLSDFDMIQDRSPAMAVLIDFDNAGIPASEVQERLGKLVFFPETFYSEKKKEMVNHPAHYNMYKGLEIIDIVEKLNFNLGNAVKYIARAGFKEEQTEIQDLEKGLWYVERQIAFGDDGSLALLTFEEVEKLVGQMNFHRGNAVWLICLAGQMGKTKEIDLTESTHSIRAEIRRLKSLEE